MIEGFPGGRGRSGHCPAPDVNVKQKVAGLSVHLEKGAEGFSIPRIDLQSEADVPGISEAAFREQSEKAEQNCPVSKLLKGAQITLDARLVR